jgi:hypothetical protein
VLTPPTSAEVTAFIAAAMSWAFSPRARPVGALSIGDKTNFTVCSRQDAFEAEPHRGRIADKRQLDGLVGQRLGLSGKHAAAVIVVLLRQPTRRPRGLPDRPFSNGCSRTRPGGFGVSSSAVGISLVQWAGPFRQPPLTGSMQC